MRARGVKTAMGVIITENSSPVVFLGQKGCTNSAKGTCPSHPTRYQAFSQDGISPPLGLPYHPSGYGHTIISDVNNNRTRASSLLECWLITGGNATLFEQLPHTYVANAILTSTTQAVQLYIIQLALVPPGANCTEEMRVGPKYLVHRGHSQGIACSRHKLNQASHIECSFRTGKSNRKLQVVISPWVSVLSVFTRGELYFIHPTDFRGHWADNILENSLTFEHVSRRTQN